MIKIFTDSEGIKETTNQLLTELNYYTGCLEAVKQIANKDDIISLNELEADILKGTNFSDVNKVAELRGCYDAYKFFKDYHNKYDLNNYTENLEIKKEVLDQRKLDLCHEIQENINIRNPIEKQLNKSKKGPNRTSTHKLFKQGC